MRATRKRPWWDRAVGEVPDAAGLQLQQGGARAG